MGAALKLDRTLHASLCEIERGLFHAQYRSEGFGRGCVLSATDTHSLPLYQVARSLSDARRSIALSARAIGYDAIIWEDIDAPAMVPPPAPGRDHPSANMAVSPR